MRKTLFLFLICILPCLGMNAQTPTEKIDDLADNVAPGIIVRPTETYAWVEGFHYLLQDYLTLPDSWVDKSYNEYFKRYAKSAILCAVSYGQEMGSYLVTDTVIVPETVKVDGVEYLVQGLDYAFRKCTQLKYVRLPNSILDLNVAFYQCESLRSIIIPSAVGVLVSETFSGCKALEYVELPASFQRMQGLNGVFVGCDNITTVKCSAENPPSCRDKDFTKRCYENATLYVPSNSVEEYRKAQGWENFRNIRSLEEYTAVESVSDDYEIDESKDVDIYSLGGKRLYTGKKSAANLAEGIYILRQGNKSRKFVAK